MMDKTGLKSKEVVELLETWEGLEAWRTVRLHVDRHDSQREHDEYTKLSVLTPISVNDFQNFSTTITKWEAGLLKYERIDAEFKIGTHQRRDIIMRSLAEDIKLLVELHFKPRLAISRHLMNS